MSRFKVGDKIVITDAGRIALPESLNGTVVTITEVLEKRVIFTAKGIFSGGDQIGNYYLMNGTFELESIYNSPLFAAMK